MKRPRNRHTLIVGLVLFVFMILLGTTALVGVITVTLFRLGFFPWSGRPFLPVILIILLISTVAGTALAALFGNRPLRPIRQLIAATREIANGNFDVRIHLGGPDEAVELAQSFNRMAEELAGIETLRNDFINNFSHELKTPIVSIRGFAKLLKKNDLSPAVRDEYIDIIIAESERLVDLSTNILTLSKLERQSIVAKKTPFQLDEQIRRVILMLEMEWRAKNLNLEIDLDDLVFNGDEDLLQQVWLNLIGNAIKFTPPGGQISVTLMDTDETVTARIADTGIGMSEETRHHLFDKFYQGDKSHAGAGSGLGLSLVKRIIELCAGTIRVKSQLSRGSSFTIELPKTEQRQSGTVAPDRE